MKKLSIKVVIMDEEPNLEFWRCHYMIAFANRANLMCQYKLLTPQQLLLWVEEHKNHIGFQRNTSTSLLVGFICFCNKENFSTWRGTTHNELTPLDVASLDKIVDCEPDLIIKV
jgi:hypothetical protein